MLRYAFIFLVLAVCGCASTQQNLTLAHNIDVPKNYRAGNFSEEHPGYSEGNSTIERYVNAYERGWRYAVQRYANDINFEDPSPVSGIGWMEEVEGFSDGYYAAYKRIDQLIRVYGNRRISEYLQQFRLPDEETSSSGHVDPTLADLLMPNANKYDNDLRSRMVYVQAFGDGYRKAWQAVTEMYPYERYPEYDDPQLSVAQKDGFHDGMNAGQKARNDYERERLKRTAK
jgi:hypothetical protein